MKKKLTFRAETLRELSSDELQQAHGGMPTPLLTVTFCSLIGFTSCNGLCGILIGPVVSYQGYDGRWTCMADADPIEDDSPTSNA